MFSMQYMRAHYSVVLYLFECFITFSQEIEVIWRQQWSSMTWIYAFTRYSSVLLIIFELIPVYGFVVGN